MRYGFTLVCLLGLASGRTLKRDYDNRDYYAVHLESNGDLSMALQSIGAKLEHAFGELKDHYLVSVEKDAEHSLRKRSSSIKLLEKQTLRQRHKRAFIPLEARSPQDADYLANKMEETKKTFDIQDPIFGDQWHLLNTQEAGHDINVTGVWAQGVTGKDSVVALVDDGIDMNSRDLAANYNTQTIHYKSKHSQPRNPQLKQTPTLNMSGLMDKAKSAMGKGDSSGGDQAASGGQGADSGVNKYANEGIDKATDKAGMGDKYDSKIDKVADGQIDKQMGGGKGGL